MSFMGEFWYRQAEWSQKTFGSDKERGPIGPLKHLIKEAKEALDEAEEDHPRRKALYEEIVDCQFLVFDSARRAGLGYNEFIEMCFEKLEKNKSRKWNKPVKDEAVEHER